MGLLQHLDMWPREGGPTHQELGGIPAALSL